MTALLWLGAFALGGSGLTVAMLAGMAARDHVMGGENADRDQARIGFVLAFILIAAAVLVRP
jgi:hypothetical protein